MISLLARYFIWPGQPEAEQRKIYGILCGAVGIGLNVLLFLGKSIAGILSGSIAITADAFNNLSDAGSSFVTLLGFQLAGQKPDVHHPFGHGRIEYLSGLAVSMLILLMGVELAKSSLDKILHPAPVESGPVVIAILCVSIAVKLYMTWYNRGLGKKLDAPAMLATAADSFQRQCGHCRGAGRYAGVTGHRLDDRRLGGHLGGGLHPLVRRQCRWETFDPLLGTPPSKEFVDQIRTLVLAHPAIIGIHDLIVHDYGPGRCMISLHAEVSASENVLELHDEIDNVEKELREKLGCDAVVHMDPIVTDDGVTADIRRRVAA